MSSEETTRPGSNDPSSLWKTLYWPEPPARLRWLMAALAVCAVMAVGSVIVWRSEPSTADWAADVALRIHAALDDDHTVALEPSPLEAPMPPALPPSHVTPPPVPLAPKEVSRPIRSMPPTRSSPAESKTPPGPVAAPALAGATTPQDPLDFSSVRFVAGSATGPVSGAVTSGAQSGARGARGTGIGDGEEAKGPPRPNGENNRARAVTLSENAWDCPWPASADEHERDEAVVELSVQVLADGRASSVRVLRDPGLGFGEAARACAMRTAFEPARDVLGAPLTAWSPPIRVSFRR